MLINPQSSSFEHDRCCTDIPTKEWYSLNEFIFCHHKQLLATTFFHLFLDCSWLPRDWNEKGYHSTENKYWPIIRQHSVRYAQLFVINCYIITREVLKCRIIPFWYKCVRRGNKFPCFNKNPQFNWTEQRNGSGKCTEQTLTVAWAEFLFI